MKTLTWPLYFTIFTLQKKGSNCDIFVKVEINGCPNDCSVGSTKVCSKNTFNPLWNEKFSFGPIHEPELAVIRFSVYNQVTNPVPKSEILCQATLPLNYLRYEPK